jgi:hypothetical protein
MNPQMLTIKPRNQITANPNLRAIRGLGSPFNAGLKRPLDL